MKLSVLVLATMLGASAASAATFQPVNSPAPTGTPETRYCLRVGPLTGNLVETVECWTRKQWAEQGVNVDQEWAREGVRVIG